MTHRTKLGALALFFLSAAAVGGCSNHTPVPERQPTPVKVRTVEETAGPALARYSGTLDPATKVDMAFRVNGYVEMVGPDKGDFVKKGTVLARIRSSDYTQKVATARASVSQAKSEETLANIELERSKKLYESKAITKAELDSRIARADSAKANVEGAIARVGEAGVALDDTVLRAPMDGVILSRSAEVGMLVSPGQHALTIADIRTVKAVFGVPQALVEKLQVGSPVEIELDKTIEAKVTRIAPAADAKGRVFSVEAAIPNESGALRPGSVVSVHIPDTTLASSSLAVPLSAVVRAPSKPRGFSVFILDGQSDRATARMRDVKLGQVLGNLVTVTDGLEAGQRVVTVGSTLLRDGSDAVVIR